MGEEKSERGKRDSHRKVSGLGYTVLSYRNLMSPTGWAGAFLKKKSFLFRVLSDCLPLQNKSSVYNGEKWRQSANCLVSSHCVCLQQKPQEVLTASHRHCNRKQQFKVACSTQSHCYFQDWKSKSTPSLRSQQFISGENWTPISCQNNKV